MTRLISEWINEPDNGLKMCNEKLLKLTGMDISALAFLGAGTQLIPKPEMKRFKAAVVRFTAGEGIIGCFAESVASVLSYMGAEVFIPDTSDAAGVYEAVSRGAEILFMADDYGFIALNIKTGKAAENDIATVKGYLSVLSAMAGGVLGRDVLLLGYGRLGQKALDLLLEKGANVNVYDKDRNKTALLKNENVNVLSELRLPISGLVLDVTSEGGWLGAKDVSKDAMIAAPGIPLSLDNEAYLAAQDRVFHDKLQTGVAVMLAMVINEGGGSDGSQRI